MKQNESPAPWEVLRLQGSTRNRPGFRESNLRNFSADSRCKWEVEAASLQLALA